ncbi:uncharacterized protein LOC143844963 [Paroedura picta]|uniref:uncharacterized protein LOC143844963 n=1 Tax=Paroedura picta TaxID=143630 RepID=UPI004057209B
MVHTTGSLRPGHQPAPKAPKGVRVGPRGVARPGIWLSAPFTAVAGPDSPFPDLCRPPPEPDQPSSARTNFSLLGDPLGNPCNILQAEEAPQVKKTTQDRRRPAFLSRQRSLLVLSGSPPRPICGPRQLLAPDQCERLSPRPWAGLVACLPALLAWGSPATARPLLRGSLATQASYQPGPHPAHLFPQPLPGRHPAATGLPSPSRPLRRRPESRLVPVGAAAATGPVPSPRPLVADGRSARCGPEKRPGPPCLRRPGRIKHESAEKPEGGPRAALRAFLRVSDRRLHRPPAPSAPLGHGKGRESRAAHRLARGSAARTPAAFPDDPASAGARRTGQDRQPSAGPSVRAPAPLPGAWPEPPPRPPRGPYLAR